MANTATSGLDNQLSGYYVDKALATLINETPLYQYAMKTPLTGGKGTIVYWNAWNRLTGASAAATEGATRTAVAMSSRRVSATVAQYIRVVSLTDLAEYTTVLNAREGAQARLRESAKETQEWILHTGIFKATYYTQNQSTTVLLSAMMSGLASSMCANTGTNSNSNKQFAFPAVYGTSCARLSAVLKTAPSVSAKASLYAIRKAGNKLDVKNAPKFADGTRIGYCHPNFLHILRQDPAFLAWNQNQYAGQTMHVGEVLKTEGVRWISSNLCPRYAVTAHSVNVSFIFTPDSFGITEALGGLEMFLVTGATKDDPANQLTLLSYKITAAAACLNTSAGVLLFTTEKL
jgi:N4-gp56 family major capsid protein